MSGVQPDRPEAADEPIAAAATRATHAIFADNSYSIGQTPLVRLARLGAGCGATILGKVEGRNPSFSVKCRVGAAMVWDAERRGVLSPDRELIEPTSGNTGIALAFVAAARGYRLTLTMPEHMSDERRRILRAFGAKLVLTDPNGGMAAAVAEAERLCAADPDRYLLLQQFRNPANPEIHRTTTGPEIWADTGGQIDALVAGVGTGGTISGVSRFLKLECDHRLLSVAVEPAESPVITDTLAGRPPRPQQHRIQGIGADFVPENLDLAMVDEVQLVDYGEAREMAQQLALREGILTGASAGAAVAAAIRVAQRPELDGGTVVVVLPDSGERYLSTALFGEGEVR